MTVQRVGIACPNCGHELHVRTAALGRKGLCRHCGHKFIAAAEGHQGDATTHGPTYEHRRRGQPDGDRHPAFLAADLRDALGRLRLERNLHRAVREQLEEAWAKLADTQARERALQSDLADYERVQSELDALRAECAQRAEDAERLAQNHSERGEQCRRLGERVTELEGFVAELQSERDEIAGKARDQHERDDAECIALATEVARLQDRGVALESELRALREERGRVAQATKAAHDDLSASCSRLTTERDELAREAAGLATRLNDSDAAREAAERALASAQARAARAAEEATRAEADRWATDCAALRGEADRLQQRLEETRERRARAARALRRARVRWTTRLHDAETRWQAERGTLHEGFERSLRDRIEQFEIERRGLHEQLDAVHGTGDELDALRREVESLRQLLDDVRAERDSALRRAETQVDYEAVIAGLRNELAERSDEHDAQQREHAQALAALRQQADEQTRERDDTLRRLKQSEAEVTALRATVSSVETSGDEARAAADGLVERMRSEFEAAVRERDELRLQAQGSERERQALAESLRAAEASAGEAGTGARDELERLRAEVEKAARERDALRAQLDAQEQQRRALQQELDDTHAAVEGGRQAAMAELERLRQHAVGALQQRNEAVLRMQEMETKLCQAPAIGAAPHAGGLARRTKLATHWLDGILSQMSRLDLSAQPDKRILLERLRTVRQALAEQVAGPAPPVADQPRPRSEDFADSRQFRAALAQWLDRTRERRRAATLEFGRLRSELKSARSELDLLDRDLVLGDWDPDGSAMFPVDAVAEVAQAHSRLDDAG